MKSLKIFFFGVFLSLFFTANAQLINCNPDQDGEPCWTGGLPELTPEFKAELDAIPPLVLTPESISKLLPDKVDNSEHIWFRPIFKQKGGSCAQAAGVAYVFTYEVNRVRNLPANVHENQYPTHFTWNFLNSGAHMGSSSVHDGWNIIKESGVPSVADYGNIEMDFPNSWLFWMTGYNKYLKALGNRVIENYYSINVSTPEGLNILKHWLADHGDGSDSGGLATFGSHMDGDTIYAYLPPQSYDAGQEILLQFGSFGGHAMTIVGYNDNIKFDFNGDGQFTNPGNDMSQWEIGAVKVANSWGDWKNDGFIYIPYRLLPNIYSNTVQVLKVKKEYNPEIVLKTLISYPCRNKINLGVGYGNDANSINPSTIHYIKAFLNRGGCYPMQDINSDPIELALDYNQKPEYNTSGKVYFVVRDRNISGNNEGFIFNFSLFDYRWGEEFELPCNESNTSIINNGNTFLAVDYHLLPHKENVSQNLLLTSNRVSRFTTNVTNNATLEMNSGVRTDMYNSTIYISQGSTLKMNNGSSIVAKRGNCKVIIDGNINIGQGVSFVAEEGANLELIFNNRDIDVDMNSVTFERCKISTQAQANISIKQSNFTDCGMLRIYGNIDIEDSYFYETGLSLSLPGLTRVNMARVHNCTIINQHTNGIIVNNYPMYMVTNNIVKTGINIGISIYNSGQATSFKSGVVNNDVSNSNIGVDVYSSSCAISMNKIYNNLGFGLRLMNISNVSVSGNPNVNHWSLTQQIRDNSGIEVYVAGSAFPAPFRYNAIIDDDNLGMPAGDPLIYFGIENPMASRQKDVKYNYWGNSFIPIEDLFPISAFMYTPIWNPGTNATISTAETMYEQALSASEAGNNAEASNTYRSIVANYPETEFAQSSLKQLLYLEQDLNNDYASLQGYYRGISNASLLKLADILSNKCDEKMGNFERAIAWYENVIANPACLEDSVFAEIDLRALELQMNGTRSGVNTSDAQEFEEERDYLLSLLPGNTTVNQSVTRKNADIELTNYPNPFIENTSISFRLLQKGNVTVTVSDFSGFVLDKVQLGNLDSGKHKFAYNGSKLSAGIYFYSIRVDGKTVATNRMIINK